MKSGMEWGHDEDLNTVVSQLHVGDQVLVNDRSIPLEVFDRDRERMGSDPHPTEAVYLEGRGGRVYRLLGNYLIEKPNGETKVWDKTPPRLQLRREGEWSPSRTVSRLKVAGGQEILSSVRAGEFLATVGIELEGTEVAEVRAEDGDSE